MTATDELRRLLDERGVEWIGTDFAEPTHGHPTNTSLGSEHHDAVFIEYHDGNALRLFDLTPEQAVEATLGRGTCHAESDLSEWVCSACQCWIPLGLTPENIQYASEWRYCPHCGAEVKAVSDDER